jgi:receptor protein-tyrosine kinase
VLDQFAEQYDVVLLDTPATSETADAQIVSALAGAAILLARRNHTRQAQLTAAMHSLTQSAVKVIGSVVTEY